MTPENLPLSAGAPGETWIHCPASRFADTAVGLAAGALLSDLFATWAGGRHRLTAVFQAHSAPGWLLLNTDLEGPRFTSLTPRLHVASWYEREIKEMFGLEPEGHPAPVRLRLHDWPQGLPPMRAALEGVEVAKSAHHDRLPTVRGQGVFQLPLGPVRSGPQESGEFLFNSGGEDLVMISPLLGYKLRLVERLAQGRRPEAALALVERLAGTSTFANSLAFVEATERALGVAVSASATHARSLGNELERLHSHFGDLGRLMEATGHMVAGAQYQMLREEVLRACAACTGHRYLRGFLTVGGVAAAPPLVARRRLRAAVADWQLRSSRLQRLLEETATIVDRLETTAVLPSDYASQHNLVGPVGRASGIDRDARRDRPYSAYAALDFEVPVESSGDALARARVRLFEIQQSLRLLEQLLDTWPPEVCEEPHQNLPRPGAALGWAEAPGGETLHFVELDTDGLILRWRARPPAVVNWHPYAYACASGNNLTDYPVIEASFGLSHAEFDR